ncbi:helix-turn-helix domain-containing protein [Sulfitobacter pseudonitzschiae]|uniref:Helix-turn-helix domain-containing protein n=1 Tax=Pseudosulfitobacter pseudonitzschiae TaxID=1402135 RepID=A0A9Q2NHY6_9RHOB|nr:SRPBCC domain-containing protein [Pseudosulfitobacter pseudonitzschiae]MBM2292397.1 helix-turn-helix domain-containing protein [Pseudosulfitobacter pseudonitzschiae]MBM2297315.1 helix-turn-helix domain-containing protein [Pseudosulfitobacter pseudonitzschiae]MBM2302229.1 helix-turn-helix domain-containing protein [Pseudosulfitobacter pseudonitzschiae]MBM2312011.1 helix-turn-helix domain-containing protein [Pseudosulfitobacter pseudonitzschiae]MBM2316925.1 helix-turn-helix domain-containing 
MDIIFKALADPARRTLLDSLRRTDGQTLTDLQGQLDMTRFGVMKHLGVLEEAGLIVSRKVGRFKYHYLNALPLQEAIDRWIEPLLVKPAARAVLDLKASLEGKTMTKPDFVMQTFIRCTQDALWDALSNPDSMAAYHFMCNSVQGEAVEGGTLTWLLPDGNPMLTQRPTKVVPKTRIEATFEPHFFGPDAPASRMAFLIEPQGDMCKLTIEHYDIPKGQDGVAEGWARMASSLKSWLETGTAMKSSM